MVYLQRDHFKEASMIIRLLLEFDNDNLLWNLAYYLLIAKVLPNEDEAHSRKLLAKCERLYLRD
jgi:hypothetical protein